MIGALHYFHIACRLDRISDRPGEFLPEVILNLAKTLECVFPPGGGIELADAARTGLKKLGYSTDEIERDFIPAIYLRSGIDVAHAQLRLFTADQLKTLHTYAQEAEQKFQEMLLRLLAKVASGEIALDQSKIDGGKSNADRTIERIKQRMIQSTGEIVATSAPKPASSKPNQH